MVRATKTPAPSKRRAKVDFGRLVDKSRTALQRKIQHAIDEYGLGSFEGFNLDQKRGVMEFSDGGKVRVRGNAVIAGSIGLQSGTWLWSWANRGIEPRMREPLEKVKQYGAERGFEPLVEASFEAEEADGWSMTAVAAEVLGAECAYRVPTKTGFTFVLLEKLQRVADP